MYIVSFHFILISFHFNLFKQGKAINYTIALQAALYRKNITPHKFTIYNIQDKN